MLLVGYALSDPAAQVSQGRLIQGELCAILQELQDQPGGWLIQSSCLWWSPAMAAEVCLDVLSTECTDGVKGLEPWAVLPGVHV